MQDAAAESAEDDFYSGGEEDGFESDDADVADYEFIDNDSDDSDDLISHRHQVLFYSSWQLCNYHPDLMPFVCCLFLSFDLCSLSVKFDSFCQICKFLE